MKRENLEAAESHFEFGKNWASYADQVDALAIHEAELGLAKLVPVDELAGRTFLDIGCGSGLHSLAALRRGASRVAAIDIDADSVATTERMLSQHAPDGEWTAQVQSILDSTPETHGTFDVVYSWGVLHHTGNMWRAIDRAAALVAPRGLFAFALYRRTRLDGFWRVEKRWYTHASPRARAVAQGVYIATHRVAFALLRRNHREWVKAYRERRGMEFTHDVHDWLGGYPYESVTAAEVHERMHALGFRKVRTFARVGVQLGVFGSGCDEFVYRRD